MSSAPTDVGGYDRGYRNTECFWGRDPGSLVIAADPHVRDYAGLRVLDAGCGEGKNTAYFRSRGSHVDAFDVSEAALTNARALWPGQRFELGDALTAPLPTAEYSVVIAYGLLHCLPTEDTVKRVADRLKQATAPGGLQIVCALNSRLNGFDIGHPDFRPALQPHDLYVALYQDWETILVTDTDLTESHAPDHIQHTHAVSRLLVRRPS